MIYMNKTQSYKATYNTNTLSKIAKPQNDTY